MDNLYAAIPILSMHQVYDIPQKLAACQMTLVILPVVNDLRLITNI